jgi:hypothetical protein
MSDIIAAIILVTGMCIGMFLGIMIGSVNEEEIKRRVENRRLADYVKGKRTL